MPRAADDLTGTHQSQKQQEIPTDPWTADPDMIRRTAHEIATVAAMPYIHPEEMTAEEREAEIAMEQEVPDGPTFAMPEATPLDEGQGPYETLQHPQPQQSRFPVYFQGAQQTGRAPSIYSTGHVAGALWGEGNEMQGGNGVATNTNHGGGPNFDPAQSSSQLATYSDTNPYYIQPPAAPVIAAQSNSRSLSHQARGGGFPGPMSRVQQMAANPVSVIESATLKADRNGNTEHVNKSISAFENYLRVSFSYEKRTLPPLDWPEGRKHTWNKNQEKAQEEIERILATAEGRDQLENSISGAVKYAIKIHTDREISWVRTENGLELEVDINCEKRLNKLKVHLKANALLCLDFVRGDWGLVAEMVRSPNGAVEKKESDLERANLFQIEAAQYPQAPQQLPPPLGQPGLVIEFKETPQPNHPVYNQPAPRKRRDRSLGSSKGYHQDTPSKRQQSSRGLGEQEWQRGGEQEASQRRESYQEEQNADEAEGADPRAHRQDPALSLKEPMGVEQQAEGFGQHSEYDFDAELRAGEAERAQFRGTDEEFLEMVSDRFFSIPVSGTEDYGDLGF